MSKLRSLGFIIAGLAFFTSMNVPAVDARPGDTCSCYSLVPGNATPRETVNFELKRSPAVFSGEVVKIAVRSSGMFEGYLEVTFKVDSSWKNVNSETVTVVTAPVVKSTTPPFIRSCGYEFVVGSSYLVYVQWADGTTRLTGICSRTKKLTDATEDLQILGPSKIPTSSDDKK